MSEEEYEYVEPHPSGGKCTIRMTRQQAIYWIRQVHQGLSDQLALEAFIAVHWAYKVGSSNA